ncbi:MAG: ABC transporter ATP-binding protein [Christensenellales bacterium]|jgi:iron complex transport system ATP-binding protein
MLTLERVYAGYNGLDVIQDITAAFEPGKNYCLLGPNGCGKTTLLRAMAGIIPARGEITIGGRSLAGMRRREVARNIAVMSQITTLYFPYSVYETVMLGRYQFLRRTLFGQASAEDRAVVRRCLESAGLWEMRDKQIDKLSGGQRQRVFLAQALAQEPNVILLDEPTNHLDVRHQIDLIDALHEWTRGGERSVIGVFHDVNLALHLSEDMLFLKEGRLVGNGKFNAVASRAFLREVYDMDVVDFMRGSLEKWKRVM